MDLYLFLEQKKTIQLFAVISVATLLIAFAIRHILLTKGIYYQSFGDQLSLEQIDHALDSQNKFEFLGYFLLLVFNLIKYAILAIIIQIGAILWGFKVSFDKTFKVVIISEFVFIIPLIIKFLFFYLSGKSYTVEDVQLFYPLSFLNVLSVHSVAKIWLYPLQLLNIFEVAYWFILAYGISHLLRSNFDKTLRIILSSYLPALLIWVIFIMFLTVTLNPA